MQITWIGSPNFSKQRGKIENIIIHWFGVGNLKTTDATFQKPNGVSAHYGIEDENIHRYVKEEHTAYHSGNWATNLMSIGIEHSATPDRPASEETYKTSGWLVSEISKRYNIPLDRSHIKRHSEVVPTQCCGTVDIDKIISIAKQVTSSPSDPMLQKKASGFDRIWRPFNHNGKSPENAEEADHLSFVKWIESQRGRAGKWDLLAKKAGYTGNTENLSVDALYDLILSKASNRAEVIKELKNKLISFINKLE